MQKWLKKYLANYNAKLSGSKIKDGVIHSKLDGNKTTVKISLNLMTLYNVMFTKYKTDDSVSVYINDDKDHVSIAADDVKMLEELMDKYGGHIDEFEMFGHKYTLQIIDYNKKDTIFASI